MIVCQGETNCGHTFNYPVYWRVETVVILRTSLSMYVACKQNARRTWGANLKTAKEDIGANRRARFGEPSSVGMVNDFPLILGERERAPKARMALRTRMFALP
jgi:hypothetical protein